MNVPIILQDPGECGLACLEMCFQYFGIPFKHPKVLEEVSKNALKGGDWYFRMGGVAQKYNLESSIITRSTRIFDPSWYKLDSGDLIEKLKLRLANLKNLEGSSNWEIEELRQSIFFINSGGKIIFEALSPQILDDYLRKQYLLIVPVNANLIIPNLKRRTKDGKDDDVNGNNVGHVVLVKDFNSSDYVVNDPGGDYMHLTSNHEYLVPKDNLVESILRGDMHLLAIKNNSYGSLL